MSEKTDLRYPFRRQAPDATESVILGELCDNPAEGIAFMLVGVAGLIMSWTTFDIGAGIKEVVREVGRDNREALDSLAASQKEMAASMDRMAASQKEMAASMDRMAASQKETQEMVAASMDRMSESQNNIARLLERVVKNTGTGA